MIQQWDEFISARHRRAHRPFSHRLRHARGQKSGPGSRSLDEHAAPPVGSLRNQRHEGSVQRRPESFGAGWLVGGSDSPEVGWAIGDGKEHGEDPAWDAVEAETLYTLLEHEVVPEFYERDEKGMPAKWLDDPREHGAAHSRFSASRAIREYTENHYLPAASDYLERAADDSKLGTNLLRSAFQDIAQDWNSVRFGKLEVETKAGQYVFLVHVFPGDLSPQQIKVELYADPVQKGASALVAMTASKTSVDSAGTIVSFSPSTRKPSRR